MRGPAGVAEKHGESWRMPHHHRRRHSRLFLPSKVSEILRGGGGGNTWLERPQSSPALPPGNGDGAAHCPRKSELGKPPPLRVPPCGQSKPRVASQRSNISSSGMRTRQKYIPPSAAAASPSSCLLRRRLRGLPPAFAVGGGEACLTGTQRLSTLRRGGDLNAISGSPLLLFLPPAGRFLPSSAQAAERPDPPSFPSPPLRGLCRFEGGGGEHLALLV
jgi:hypothetical protein